MKSATEKETTTKTTTTGGGDDNGGDGKKVRGLTPHGEGERPTTETNVLAPTPERKELCRRRGRDTTQTTTAVAAGGRRFVYKDLSFRLLVPCATGAQFEDDSLNGDDEVRRPTTTLMLNHERLGK